MADKILVDGTSVWDGGFNTSSSPHNLKLDQYVLGVNVQIPKNNGGISSRNGYRHVNFIFENDEHERIYRNGSVQGEGWYFDGEDVRYLLSVDGWIFEFTRISRYSFSGTIRNLGIQNNPTNIYAWITRVPYGAIINDGESSPIYLTKGSVRRTNPNNHEIGVGLMGVYVQNRFFYVTPDRRNIYASTIDNPISLLEAEVNNIYGFKAPEDEDFITAIGKSKTILRDALGGNLSFSTIKNNYSIDIRGPRENWGNLAGQGLGYVQNSVPDIGAISSYSYESFNGNLYFRNSKFGLMSTKHVQSQFVNTDAYSSHSIEAELFFNRDTKLFLSKCYTRGFNTKLYTTIAPQLKDNNIIWNGLIVYSPDVYYSSTEKSQRRFESIYTGIRPWCITVIEDSSIGEEMMIHSHDFDGVNRAYILDTLLDYDLDKNNKRTEIESKIVTRAYTHGDDFLLKKSERSFYSISNLVRDTDVKISTRAGDTGSFQEIWNTKHRIKSCSFSKSNIGNNCFKPVPVHPENRELVNVKRDSVIEFKCRGACAESTAFSRQDLFEIKGSFRLRRWVRIALQESTSTTVDCNEKDPIMNKYSELKLYDYKLSK